jgi:hypothetical protein
MVKAGRKSNQTHLSPGHIEKHVASPGGRLGIIGAGGPFDEPPLGRGQTYLESVRLPLLCLLWWAPALGHTGSIQIENSPASPLHAYLLSV